MTKKCVGCAAVLQSNHSEKEGFVRKDKIEVAEYCEKCFKLIHYGKNIGVSNNIDTSNIIKDINNSGYPVIYIIDILNMNNSILEYLNEIKTSKYVLLTKFDLLPRGIKEGKIIKYFKENYNLDNEVFCVSGKNKHNIEKFYNHLKKDGVDNVYVVGLTNAGKSTFINSLLSLNNIKTLITTSNIPNTTRGYLNIKINDINFIDTPGFNEEVNIYKYLSEEDILKLKPKKEIKVKTFQIKSGYSIIVEKFLRIDYLEGHTNSINFYMNNNLIYKKVKTVNNKELITLSNKIYNVENKKDIVIEGLGFFKINKKGTFKVYSIAEDIIDIRNNMI